ncbi:hypothetical protein [Massilia sp. ZL223]|uniref:hypothetical protein n=1 Tax=Massilia sp. ZL223 TaxID=2824904 RepID=UPI001B838D42|nr:hypothetical protein [Massilia sp. ZL223]MBQ5962744.1 hypothetical protein [Massilia sp. ZL223]
MGLAVITLLSTSGRLTFACATLLLGILASPDSSACRALPRKQIVTPDEQIAIATDVSVARVVRATPLPVPVPGMSPDIEYEFEVQERILGPDDKRFILIGGEVPTRTGPSSDNHSDKAFWERNGGRLYHGTDCLLKLDFVVGEHYLVFRGKPATRRSFEHIDTVGGRPDPDDKWLSYVKERLGGRQQ